jgi:tetratricopeptide (TPR) repeat protein
LLGIVVLAFAVRLIYIFELRQSPLFDAPQMDELYHDQWARAIAAGEQFVEGPYFRAPLYPFFLGAIYKVFGDGYLAPRIVQSLLGSLSCGLVFMIGRRAFGYAVGAIAGFVAAAYWILIYFDAELLIPSLIVFLNLLMLWTLLWAARHAGKFAYGLAGLTLGLSAVARPNILLFAPAVVVWLGVLYRPAWKRAVTYVVCFGSGCLVAVLPVTIRNYVVGDDLVLIASQGGVNFFIGNNAGSDGQTAVVPGTPLGWWEGYHASTARAEQAVGRPLKPSEVSRYYFLEAFQFLRTQPAKAFSLTARKLWLFWGRWEIPNNKDIYFWTERFTPVIRFLPLGFGVIGPLGLLGLVLCGRRRLELFPLWGFILIYMVSVVIFFCTARYRAPVLGPLVILAAYALLSLIRAVGSALRTTTTWRRPIGFAVVLIVAGLFVNTLPTDVLPPNDAQSYASLATAYRARDRSDLAVDAYYRAVEADPDSLTSRYGLATLLGELGRISEAVDELDAALPLTTEARVGVTPSLVAGVHRDLAVALHSLDRLEEAIPHYRKAIELDPDGGGTTAYDNLASILASLGRLAEAVTPLRQAIARDSDHLNAHYNLAWVLVQLGQADDAIIHFREVLRIDPSDATAWYDLGRVLAGRGRSTEAIEALTRSLQLRPHFAPAIDELAALLSEDGQADEANTSSDRTSPVISPTSQDSATPP